jgi:hypothetical protein
LPTAWAVFIVRVNAHGFRSPNSIRAIHASRRTSSSSAGDRMTLEAAKAPFAAGSHVMPIEAASSMRTAASDIREANRQYAHEIAVDNAYWRRDQRVEEARASAAARPTPAERAAEAPPPRERAPSSALLLDVLA